MRTVLFALIAVALLLTTPGRAQNMKFKRTLTVTSSTAQSCFQPGDDPTINSLVATVETAAVRWNDDGTAPTSSTGSPAAPPITLSFFTVFNAQNFQVIAQGTTATVWCVLGRP